MVLKTDEVNSNYWKRNWLKKDKPMLRFMLMLLAQWFVYWIASVTKHIVEFIWVWHFSDMAFLTLSKGVFFIFRADLEHGQFPFSQKTTLFAQRFYFQSENLQTLASTKILRSRTKSSFEFPVDLSSVKIKTSQVDWRPGTQVLSFLLHRMV